jgi:ribonuclease P protein component
MPIARHRFPPFHRLGGYGRFASIRAAAIRHPHGPLVFWAAPNQLTHCRLGISLPRQVGTAVRRNRIKRLLKESYRILQHDLPAGYDLLISVRPHEPMALEAYQKIFSSAVGQLHIAWQKRGL